jgi:hypothetical protein
VYTVHVYMVYSIPGEVSSWQVGMSGEQQDRMYTLHVYMVYSIPGVVSSWQVGMLVISRRGCTVHYACVHGVQHTWSGE